MSILNPQQIAFRNRVIALARRIAPRYNIPWRIMASVAILESAWGEAEPAQLLHNYFNLRSLRNDGFRKFRSMAESFHAFGKSFDRLSASPDPDYTSKLFQITRLFNQPTRSSHAQRSR